LRVWLWKRCFASAFGRSRWNVTVTDWWNGPMTSVTASGGIGNTTAFVWRPKPPAVGVALRCQGGRSKVAVTTSNAHVTFSKPDSGNRAFEKTLKRSTNRFLCCVAQQCAKSCGTCLIQPLDDALDASDFIEAFVPIFGVSDSTRAVVRRIGIRIRLVGEQLFVLGIVAFALTFWVFGHVIPVPVGQYVRILANARLLHYVYDVMRCRE
jgi:hypothetical protein